jgi:hypothetical protein
MGRIILAGDVQDVAALAALMMTPRGFMRPPGLLQGMTNLSAMVVNAEAFHTPIGRLRELKLATYGIILKK